MSKTSNKDNTQRLFVEAGTGIAIEKDGKRRCLGCMELYDEEYEVCPYCGYTIEEDVENALHMYPGTVLYDKYVIGKVIGYGGFGVTYLAWDTVLQIKVAIKEYLPSEFSTRSAGQTQITVFSGDKSKQFNDGMEKFIDEAKRLAKFRSENGIVKIFDSFGENGTAYIAMEYLQGETLAERLEREKTIPVEEAIQMLMPIIESLNRVHDEGIIHRDIAPDNIFLTNKGEVKLIDFGASRYATTSRSRSLTVIIKPGYSAEEQYRSRGDQGSHTDVYSVGAVLYRMVTGQAPPDAMERRALFEKNGRDMLVPIKKFDKNIDPRRENAIYNALNIRIEDRTPDMISLAGELLSEEPVKKRRSGIKKIDPLTWPLWAKIGIPSGLAAVVALCVLFAFGVIGPKSDLETRFVVPDGQTLIPNVVAGTYDDAKKKLEKEDLNYVIGDQVKSAVIDRNLVLSQDPDAYNVVDQGTTINIILSDGFGMSTVPDVVGFSLEAATEKLKEAGYTVTTKEENSNIIAKGAVISQQYKAGTMLEKNNSIELVISKGPEGIDTTKVVKVPNIVGMDYAKAQKALAKYNLFAAIDREEFNERIPVNQVLGQFPLDGDEVHQGDTIYVTINRGKKTVYVPDVVNKKLESALYELEELGLVVDITEKENAEYAAGVVFAQNVKAGTAVNVGSKVVVTVSTGYSVTVPDVTGERLDSAREQLVALGLAVSVQYQQSDSVAKDRVISQDNAGKKVSRGSTVTLVVSSGKNGSSNTDDVDAKALTKLEITKKPKSKDYYIGDKFDTNGMEITAHYANGSSKVVTEQCHLLGDTFTSAGSGSVKFTYEENGIEKTISLDIVVATPTVTFDKETYNVVVDNSVEFSATAKPSGTIKYSVENSNVASISGNKLNGKIAGERTMLKATLEYKGKEYTASVTVKVLSREVAVEKIELTESIKLSVEKSAALTATVVPSEALANRTITWKSKDTSVASAKSTGQVTAKVTGWKAGTTEITATCGGKESNVCTVTVVPLKVKSLEKISNPTKMQYFSTDTIELEGIHLKAKFEGGDYGDVYEDDLTIVSADISKKGDKVPITVEYKGEQYTFYVKVSDPFVTLESPKENERPTINIGGEYQIEISTGPKDDMKVEYKIPDAYKDKATVDSTGRVIGKSAGDVEVEVIGTYLGHKYKQTAKFTVLAKTVESIVKVKGSYENEYFVGDNLSTDKMELEVKYKGSTKTETISSGFKIKFADGSTVLREDHIKNGKASVIAEFSGKTISFDVDAKVPSITVKDANITLNAGKTAKVAIDSFECGKRTAAISWEIDDEKVARVEWNSSDVKSATVTGANEGETKIYAVLTYNSVKYRSKNYITVKVNSPKAKEIEVSWEYGTPTYYVGDTYTTNLLKDDGLKVMIIYEGSAESKRADMSSVTCQKIIFSKAGTANLEIECGGLKKSISVKVESPTVKFSLEKKTLTTAGNDYTNAVVDCTPSNGVWEFAYSSGDSAVAIVGDNGVVKPREEVGTTTITLKATYKGNKGEGGFSISKTYEITVGSAQITGIDLANLPSRTYKLGETISFSDGFKLKVTYLDTDVDQYDTSSKIQVEFKYSRGTKLKAVDVADGRTGYADITISYEGYDGKPIESTVKVELPQISASSSDVSLKVGETKSVSISVPNELSGCSISCSATSCVSASVSGTTLQIQGNSAGSEDITVYVKNKRGVVLSSVTIRVTVTESDTSGASIALEDEVE